MVVMTFRESDQILFRKFFKLRIHSGFSDVIIRETFHDWFNKMNIKYDMNYELIRADISKPYSMATEYYVHLKFENEIDANAFRLTWL